MGRIALSAKGIGRVDFTDLGLVLLVHGWLPFKASPSRPEPATKCRVHDEAPRSAISVRNRGSRIDIRLRSPTSRETLGPAIHAPRAGFRYGFGVGTATTRFYRVHLACPV